MAIWYEFYCVTPYGRYESKYDTREKAEIGAARILGDFKNQGRPVIGYGMHKVEKTTIRAFGVEDYTDNQT
jgi:hypothetical protein